MVMQAERLSEESIFSWIEQVLQHGDAAAAFEQLADRLRRGKQYRELFDARLMQKRFELGLPLVSAPGIGDVPADLQQAYQDGSVRAAREVGELLLADRNIPQAWPYFRAIGDTEPIKRALGAFDVPDPDTPESQEALGATIHIAFQEGLHPRKGFELILKHYGLCRAITMFGAYPQRDGRNESLRLLVRSLHDQLVDNLKHAISDVEGKQPESRSVRSLIDGRDWLFENNAQHTDSSHIAPVLAFSAELDDKETLRLAVDIAEYASSLAPMFQYSDDPPFERVYEDRGIYLKALLGEDVNVERAVQHFDEKAAGSDPDRDGSRPAEVLVGLLIRLGRYDEAISAFRRYLIDAEPESLACPSLLQLYQMAGDFEQLRQLAKQQSDPLSYMAALIQGAGGSGQRDEG
jgi:tetratricopeptide (TPR) repeat protein